MTHPRKYLLGFYLLFVSTVLGIPTRAQETRAAAPADIMARMPAGYISDQFAVLPIGAGRSNVEVHVFHREVADADPSQTTKTPMYAEFYLRHRARLRLVHRIAFHAERSVHEIVLKWLHPRTRQGPVVLLHSAISDGSAWNLLIFPHGLAAKPILQEFIDGGEQDGGVGAHFDYVDKNGNMVVREEWSEGFSDWTEICDWNGLEFENRSRPYFVIAASATTRRAAELFMAKHRKALDESVIRPSSLYSKLRPGYFVVIDSRFSRPSDAERSRRYLKMVGIDAYVKRAF